MGDQNKMLTSMPPLKSSCHLEKTMCETSNFVNKHDLVLQLASEDIPCKRLFIPQISFKFQFYLKIDPCPQLFAKVIFAENNLKPILIYKGMHR